MMREPIVCKLYIHGKEPKIKGDEFHALQLFFALTLVKDSRYTWSLFGANIAIWEARKQF